MQFRDRESAGEELAAELVREQSINELEKKNLVVVAIPRGGVVVGKVVAKNLGVRQSVVVTKKLGAPGMEELALGAVAEDGEAVVDENLVARLGVEEDYIRNEVRRVQQKIKDYVRKFRGEKKLQVSGKTVVVVDDGVATGATIKAAIKWLREKTAGKVIVAAPVCAIEAARELEELADGVICLETPENFSAVGQFYENFPQVTDEEVVEILSNQ
ncbi:MAG: phosphoribosyltransferase [Candidatus Chisholmbacteria bacterium]|nr:phosphoribosyltransferase [Candidatus Chisholmbacteria bacterium]